MRQFKNCVQLIKELPREVFTRGIIAQDTTNQGKIVDATGDFEQKELYGTAYTLNSFEDRDEMLDLAREMFGKTHLRKEVVLKWFDEMIHNDSLLETWWFEDPYTKEYFYDFCNEGTVEEPICSYTYGNKIIPQLPFLIKRLKNNIYARGAYITIFDNNDVSKIGHRVGCTLNYGFSVRNTLHGKQMNMFIHMRSQDLANFMSLDIYKASLLLEYVAKEIGVDTGKIICYVDSLHLYKRDIKNLNITW